MKNASNLIIVGFAIYIIMSGIDKFVYSIPNTIYIPVGILSVVFVCMGSFKRKRKNKKIKFLEGEILCIKQN